MSESAFARIETFLVALAMLAFVWIAHPRIDRAPLGGHSWRQALAASVARNYRCGEPAALPRLDACGTGPNAGIQAMELPAYAWLMARLSFLGVHRGEHVVSILGALLFLAGIALLARRREEGPPLAGAAPVAVAVCLASPLFLFYGATLLPDVIAFGLTLAGAVLALADRRSLLVVGSVVMSVGIATKLVAPPIAVFTGTALLLRITASSQRDRRVGDFALHVGLVSLVPIAWYLGWSPHLARLDSCQLFWMKIDHPLRSITTSLPSQLHGRLGELFGPGFRIAAYVGLVVTIVLRRFDSLPLVLFWLASALLWAMLGWHHDAHEYDALIFLAPAALSIGGGVGLLLDRLSRPVAQPLAIALAFVAAFLGLHASMPQLPKREKVEVPALVTVGHELDLVLPRQEALLVPDSGADPRVSYFAARRTFNGPLDCGHPKADCALVLRPNAPVCGHATSAVFFPSMTLTCGLTGAPVASREAWRRGEFVDVHEGPGTGVRAERWTSQPNGSLRVEPVAPPRDRPATWIGAVETRCVR